MWILSRKSTPAICRGTEGCFIGRDERSQNLSAVATNFSRTQGASLERQAPRRKCGYRLPRPGLVTGFRNRPSTSSRPASAEVFDEGLLRGDLLALNLSADFRARCASGAPYNKETGLPRDPVATDMRRSCVCLRDLCVRRRVGQKWGRCR